MGKGISVIIPAYNSEKFITETILSILNQNYKHTVEIIVSDDGSTDGTIPKVEKFGLRVKIVEKAKDCNTQGASSARNRGIRASTQPFVCFLDSDDIYLPGHFEKIMPPLENNAEIGFIFCRVLEFKTKDNLQVFRPWTRDRIFKNDVKNPAVSRNKIVHTSCFMFRKEVFNQVGYFNEAYPNGEDGDLWMRISEQFKGMFIDYFGSAYRTDHGIHQLTKNSREKIKQCNQLIIKNATKRYCELKLKDQRRIFGLKLKLLQSKSPSSKKINFKYHIQYLMISVQHPLGYFQNLIENYYEKKVKWEERNKWHSLEHFNIHVINANK